jgi:putative phosphoesterase
MSKNGQKRDELTVGIISDTHGLLRPEALDVLQNSDLIVHAGDIGSPLVINGLEDIAPVIAVRGNMDSETWASKIPFTEVFEVKGLFVYVIHDIARLDVVPETAGIRIIISGHSHKPLIREEKGILYINPGSAGPRRFTLPVSVSMLRINGDSVDAKIIKIKV